MTTIIKAANPAQFVSLVPRMLGFTPTGSLVLVPFAGTRSLGAMRLDLPSPGGDVDAFASTCIGMVCRLPGADAVAAVIYCDDGFDGDRPPHDDLSRALAERADASGLRVTDALCVAADAWGSFLDPELPKDGRPLSELDQLPSVDLPPVSGDQRTGAGLPEADQGDRGRVEGALRALHRSITVVCGGPEHDATDDSVSAGGAGGDERVDPQALAAVCLLDDLPSLFEDALRAEPDTLDAYRAAALVWCLARPSVRDVALVQWCSGFAAGDEALEAQLRWEAGEAYPDHIAQRMWGDGEQPDPQRLETALGLCRRLAAVAPSAERPGALAVCAWLSWALGRSTHAEVYASAAREIEPEHGLSEIVLSFVAAGHLPDWAFRRAGAAGKGRRTAPRRR